MYLARSSARTIGWYCSTQAMLTFGCRRLHSDKRGARQFEIASLAGGRGQRAPCGAEIGPQLHGAALEGYRFGVAAGNEMAEPLDRQAGSLRVIARAQSICDLKLAETFLRQTGIAIGNAQNDARERKIRIALQGLGELFDSRSEVAARRCRRSRQRNGPRDRRNRARLHVAPAPGSPICRARNLDCRARPWSPAPRRAGCAHGHRWDRVRSPVSGD